jgi:hypothetical protein
LWQELEQRLERVVQAGGHHVVVVDQHEALRTGPPGAIAQLIDGDVGGRPPAAHVLRDRCGHLCGVLRRAAVPHQVLRIDQSEQRAAVVDEHQTGGGRIRIGGNDRRRQRPQERRLATAPVAVHDQIRVSREIEPDRF